MEEKEIEVLLLIDPNTIPLGVEEGLTKHFNENEYVHENTKYKVKFLLRQSLEGMERERIPEIWIVNPALLAKIKPSKEELAGVRWMQSVFAGMNLLVNYFKTIYEEGEELPFEMTRLGGAFGKPMAEWTIGQMIAHERHFHIYKANQRAHQWKQLLQYRTLDQITVGIIGYGEIGREIAIKAKAFNMTVLAFKRTIREEERADPYVDRISDDVEEIIPHADYLINVLPSTSLTKGFFSRDLIERTMKDKERKRVMINIGRGDVITTETLLYALDHGHLHHAILDVFDEEPMREEHPIWSRDDVDVIPHVSGVSMPSHVISLFHSNFLLYIKHLPLLYTTRLSNEY